MSAALSTEAGGEHVLEAPPDEIGDTLVENRLGEDVRVANAPIRGGGDQPTVDAVDDDLVELLEVRYLIGGAFQLLPHPLQVGRQPAANQGDGAARHRGEQHRVEQRLQRHERQVRQPLGWDETRPHGPENRRIENGREAGQAESAHGPQQEDTAVEHGDRIEDHEAGANAPDHVDEGADDQQVRDDLAVDQQRRPREEAQRQRVEHRDAVRGPDDVVERVYGKQVLGDRLHVDRYEQQGGHHDQPEEHGQLQASFERRVHVSGAGTGAYARSVLTPPPPFGLR